MSVQLRNLAPGNRPSAKIRRLVYALKNDCGLTNDEFYEVSEYLTGVEGGHTTGMSLGEVRRLVDGLKGWKAVELIKFLRPHVMRGRKPEVQDAILGLAAAMAAFVPVIEAEGLDWRKAIKGIKFDGR